MNNEEKPKNVKASAILNTEMPAVTGGPETPKPEPEPAKPEPANAETGIMHNGRLYDPAKFRTNADGTLALNKYGQPMPKGGRKKGNGTNPETGANGAASFIPPEMPPPAGPENGPEAGMGPEADPRAEMPAASPKAVAEVATNAGYALTGALIGNPKAARPSSAEHANLRDTAAAYIEARGLRFVGGTAIAIAAAAYFLGEERRAAIWAACKRLWEMARRGKQPKDVTPAAVASQPQQARPTAPAPKAFQDVF